MITTIKVEAGVENIGARTVATTLHTCTHIVCVCVF